VCSEYYCCGGPSGLVLAVCAPQLVIYSRILATLLVVLIVGRVHYWDYLFTVCHTYFDDSFTYRIYLSNFLLDLWCMFVQVINLGTPGSNLGQIRWLKRPTQYSLGVLVLGLRSSPIPSTVPPPSRLLFPPRSRCSSLGPTGK
jgi:hypothetical protein